MSIDEVVRVFIIFLSGCDICPARLFFAPAKMCFYLLKRKSRLDPTMTGERYFSKVAVHPFQPPSFFPTADLKLSRLPPRSPLPFAALPSVSLPPAAPLADESDKISSALRFGARPHP
jgi:hypothetical protein